MSKTNWFEQIPQWIWLSFIPVIGGVAHIYAGWQTKKIKWMYWGGGFIVGSIVLGHFIPHLSFLIWTGQIVTAYTFVVKFT